jgi:maltooligosyltrehalose trehalohydrolase
MMVFLDVVYNHFGPDGNYLHSYAPDFFRHDSQTLWGATIDFRRPEVAEFFSQNALYWLQEYRVDGLRLDAVHAISEPSWLPALGQRIRAEIGTQRHVHLVLEHDGNAAHLLGYGAAIDGAAADSHTSHVFDAQWNDDAHHVLHVLLTGEDSGYYAAYADAPAEKLARCLQRVRLPGRGITLFGRGTRRAQRWAAQHGLRQLPAEPRPDRQPRLWRTPDGAGPSAGLACGTGAGPLAPQIPMLFMGEEFCAVQPFLYFTSHRNEELAQAVRQGRRREFARFPQFADPALLEQIPDPNSFATFVSSIPEPGPAPGSAACLRRVAELLHLRKRHIARSCMKCAPWVPVPSGPRRSMRAGGWPMTAH